MKDMGFSMKRAFKIVYFLGMLVEMAIRVPHERQRRQTTMVVDRVDWTERSVLGLLFVGMFFIPVTYAFTSRLDGADYRLPQQAGGPAGGAGAALLAVAVWLFWRSHADLGRNWSPSLQLREGHELVTEGVYRSIRHPMYASMWLWGIAQALLLQNWLAGWASLVLFIPLYLLRVPREERMMLDEFGGEYRAYMDRTGRVVPPLTRRWKSLLRANHRWSTTSSTIRPKPSKLTRSTASILRLTILHM
jgi:protein-S-isoprenylcysteine O-methyltransferase Ste14